MTEDFTKLSREALIERIIELESMLAREREVVDDYPDHLTAQQRSILGALYAASPRHVSTDYINVTVLATESSSTLKAQICYLRGVLRQRDIYIETAYGLGYRLTESNKAKLEIALAEGKAIRVRDSSRPVAADRNSNPK